MKLPLILITLLPLALFANGTHEHGVEAAPVPSQASNVSSTLKVVKHELPTCPIMGDPVGPGDPDTKEVVYVENGTEHHVYLCCNICVEKFNKNPQKYLKKIAEKEAALKASKETLPK